MKNPLKNPFINFITFEITLSCYILLFIYIKCIPNIIYIYFNNLEIYIIFMICFNLFIMISTYNDLLKQQKMVNIYEQ